MSEIEEIRERHERFHADKYKYANQRWLDLYDASIDRGNLLGFYDRIKNALEFAEGALENAAYCEDGLDGDAAVAVLNMINPLIRTPEEMKARAEEVAKWPVV